MTSLTSSIALHTLLVKPSLASISTKPIYGLPRMCKKRTSEVKCSMEETKKEEKSSTASAVAFMLTAVMSSCCGPALALVDERMSTEGTGLPFGLSNNLLGWILFGVFGLIWSIYFNYTSSLDEDDDSGLSL